MAQYELNIQDYLRIIKRRKWIILLTAIAVEGSVVVFTNLQTPVFQASATVKVEPSLTIAGMASTDMSWDMVTALNTEVKIIRSAVVAEMTARKLGLISENTPADKRNGAIGSIQGKVSAERMGETNLITIAATSSNARETAQIANAAAEVYIERGIDDRNRRAREQRQFIEKQMTDAEKKLKDTEEALKIYTEKNRVKGVGGYLSSRTVDLQTRKSELLKKYTEQHPEVQKIQQQIDSMDKQMRALPAEELEYARLNREVRINEELYTLLSKRYKESQISEADRVQTAFIVTPAVEPGSPIKPNRPMNMLIGAFLGVFLGFVFALLFENLDTSIGTIEDVEKYMDLPVLGIIPHVELDARQKNIVAHAATKEQKISMLRSKLIVYHSGKSPFVESYHTLRTNLKFSFKDQQPSQGTVISFTSAGIGEGKTITASNFALAAAQSGIKTLLIEADLRRPSLHWLFGVNRAPGLSDCILGTRTWESVIKGTTDFLMGSLGTDKILQYTGIENLSLMTSGPIVQNPLDLLNSPETTRIIAELSKKFELVIIDCPPVLLFADALVMGSRATGTIIVYQVGRMARRALKRAKDQLVNIKAPVAGIILNNVKTSEMGAYYGYGYYYSYKYYAKDSQLKG